MSTSEKDLSLNWPVNYHGSAKRDAPHLPSDTARQASIQQATHKIPAGALTLVNLYTGTNKQNKNICVALLFCAWDALSKLGEGVTSFVKNTINRFRIFKENLGTGNQTQYPVAGGKHLLDYKCRR